MLRDQYIKSLSDVIKREELLNEFIKMPTDLTQKDYYIAQINGNKNNFYNILSSQESRVKLLTRTGSDYINANYILDRYIATQQPNIYSHFDFWDMVYDSDIGMIVNLSGNNNYMTTNHHIHERYILDIGSLTYKNYIEIREITMTSKQDSNFQKKIYHITIINWPDFGVPDEDNFCKALNAINLIDYNSNKKIIVHCRAGVGRTGTFIAIHYLFRKFKENIYPNLIETIQEMRKSRIGMIQDKSQFLFVIDILVKKLNEIKEKETNNTKEISMTSDEETIILKSSFAALPFENKLSKSAEL